MSFSMTYEQFIWDVNIKEDNAPVSVSVEEKNERVGGGTLSKL